MATKKGLPNIGSGKPIKPSKTNTKKVKDKPYKQSRGKKTSTDTVKIKDEPIRVKLPRGRTSALEKEYTKQQRRIKNFIKRASERGFEFVPDIIPQRPKRITKASVERLRKLTPQKMYEKAKYHTPEGDIISGVAGRKRERQEAYKKGQQTKKQKEQLKKARERFYKHSEQKPAPDKSDNLGQTRSTLQAVREEIAEWEPQPNWNEWFSNIKENDKNILSRMLEGAIVQDGEEVVAERVEKQAQRFREATDKILYGSSQGKTAAEARAEINMCLGDVAEIITGMKMTSEEAKEIAEQAENWEVNN